MENQLNNTPDINSATDKPQKINIRLPVIALALDLAPFLLYFIIQLNEIFAILFVFSIFAPIAGIITGISALGQGTKQIGNAGIIISLIAILLPMIFVIVTIMRIATGAIIIGM